MTSIRFIFERCMTFSFLPHIVQMLMHFFTTLDLQVKNTIDEVKYFFRRLSKEFRHVFTQRRDSSLHKF